MKRNALEIWVGIFVALGIAAIVFLALNVANLTTQTPTQTYSVYAEFTDIGGLKVKAPVKTAGVVVGRVTNISLDTKKFVARVDIQLDKHYRFSTDASAEILTSGILGEQYVGLVQGAEEAELQNGDQITLTSSALILEQLIGKFMTSVAEKNAD
ncbi:outer membrane lipid asymmetry maintenance protein MlaD [Neisseria sp. Ec49-e6-T10]|uniref:outer membrane lipid asymmetry maintenance protein MlaD n=1 Tax=Neisseria sp. Ec49-e6-T10 TaxID=3140744 RepID=UPI003EB9932A